MVGVIMKTASTIPEEDGQQIIFADDDSLLSEASVADTDVNNQGTVLELRHRYRPYHHRHHYYGGI